MPRPAPLVAPIVVAVIMIALLVAVILVDDVVRVDGCKLTQMRLDGPGGTFDCVSRM
jgi:hypothetical protein